MTLEFRENGEDTDLAPAMRSGIVFECAGGTGAALWGRLLNAIEEI